MKRVYKGDIKVEGNIGQPGLSVGSILLTDGTNITQDADLFWDSVNKRLGIGKNNPSYVVEVQNNQNGHTAVNVVNKTAGTNSMAAVYLTSDATTAGGQVFKNSSLITTYKNLLANDLGFYNVFSGNISILNDYPSGNVNISAGAASSAQFTLNPNGNINILTLRTGVTAPTTSGTTKFIVSDSNGLLSNIPLTTYQTAITKGTATLAAGTVTVSTTAVTVGAKIFVTVNTPAGTQGFLSVPDASIVAGTSFVINSSSATETSTVNWMIIN